MIDRDELINSWEIFRDKMISALTGKGKQIMLDREKVIKKLAVRIQSDSEKWNTVELPIEEAKDILALLKEQEAKLVEIDGQLGGIKYGCCPKCGKGLNEEFYPHWCGFCGQEVKWE